MREPLESFSIRLAGFYSQERADVCPYNRDLISWPELDSRPVSLVDCLLPADRCFLADLPGRMLRERSEVEELRRATGILKPHCDSGLFRSPVSYACFF